MHGGDQIVVDAFGDIIFYAALRLSLRNDRSLAIMLDIHRSLQSRSESVLVVEIDRIKSSVSIF